MFFKNSFVNVKCTLFLNAKCLCDTPAGRSSRGNWLNRCGVQGRESQTTDSDFTNHTQVPREQITQVAAVIGTGGPDYMKLFPNLM